MSIRLTALGLIAPLLAAGCATGPAAPYPDQPNQSFALDQMRAAGFEDIHDADISKAKAAELDDTESSELAASAFGVANALAPPAGLSSISAGALGFMSWMAMGETNPARKSRVIAWVPASRADSPAEARALMVEEVTAALEVAATHTELPTGYRWGSSEHRTTNATEIYRRPIKGPDCGASDSDAFCTYDVHVLQWKYAEDDWTRTHAPAALGGDPAYRLTATGDMPTLSPSKIIDHGWSVGFPDLSLYVRMSEALPEWVMLYLAPRKVSYRSDRDGKTWRGLGLPMLLHEGGAHYFVSPESEQ